MKILGYKMDALQFVCRELKLSLDDLYSDKRDRKTIEKKWAVMCFFRLAGKSYPFIAQIVKHDNSTVRKGCLKASRDIKRVSEEIFYRYVTEVLGRDAPKIFPIQPKKKKIILKKVPDYKRNITFYKEIEV